MKLASKIECTACMACIDSCAKQALTFTISTDGYYEIAVDTNKCVDCGACTKTCTVLNHAKQRQYTNKYAYAVWSNDDEQRKHASSGGAFSAIAKTVILQGGVVYGAAIVGFKVQHIRVDCLVDLSKLQGSKYQQSEVSGVYKQVKNDLKSGLTVLFSGMSCQVEGLFAYLKKSDTTNLFTIDTICGGISTILPMLHLEATKRYKEIISFRDKENDWKPLGFKYGLKMRAIDGVIDDLGTTNEVIASFNCPYLKRSSCMDCKFNGFERVSDCTICDFWGIKQFPEQHKNGVSGLIVNNQRFMTLVDTSCLEYRQVSLKDILDYNPCYYWNKHSFLRDCSKRKRLLKSLQDGNIDEFFIELHQSTSLCIRIMFRINGWLRNKYYKKKSRMI